MKKSRFIIIGSGWRSLYYVRIAKALPEYFELCAMLCRSQEKAAKIAMEHQIYTTTSIDECLSMKPDFVVVVVNKSSIFDVAEEWLYRGVKVLCETPVALSNETLERVNNLPDAQRKNLYVAEQYKYYATNLAIGKILKKNLIGKTHYVSISLAHDYHGASLIREFLEENPFAKFSKRQKSFEFPSLEYMNRYEKFSDGRISKKTRKIAMFEFDDGKVALYDFDSEQYRSPIRKNHIKIQGETGEIFNESVTWIDENSTVHYGKIVTQKEKIITESTNPNLHEFWRINEIFFEYDDKQEILYANDFANAELNEDECAIALLMTKIVENNKDFQEENLNNAICDVKMGLL